MSITEMINHVLSVTVFCLAFIGFGAIIGLLFAAFCDWFNKHVN